MPLFLFTGNSTENPVQPNLTLTLPVFWLDFWYPAFQLIVSMCRLLYMKPIHMDAQFYYYLWPLLLLMQPIQNLVVHHKHSMSLLEKLLRLIVAYNQVKQAHCTVWSGIVMTYRLKTLTSHCWYQFRMCHRMAPSTNALSLSKVVLLSPLAAVILQAEL